ncbi:MAG: DUF1566 domain-containing protein [Desulfobacterales bacterium]|nr:DUF1566 domain-containing protein [Desulfobacterales bacterium]
MERENFYLLLELPCDPPETDPDVIEKAITKKQTEWSRLRNHPTKGLHAQKYINMIPEIRRVMTDDALRAKEAEAAREILAKDKENKYPEIDRHIDILMGKGHVTQEEKSKLARVHSLDESEIQNRINARKNVKYHRIDQQITLRIAKGYLTESEIGKIAKRNSVKVEEVRKRVRCPILKTEKEDEVPQPRQIDRSIEKTIRDNLKLLNKSSLYDFLGLPESADLKSMQDAASRKKKELASSGKKDAVATAASTLAGHCVTIFKSEQSRIAYDISLARTKLSELDSDIDIAGINGRLRPEYFETLVGKAMDFGMERSEAEKYIKDYCRRKKWTVETAPDKRRKLFIGAAAAACVLIVVASAGAYFYISHQHRMRETEFNELMQQVNEERDARAKITMLQGFIENHTSGDGYSRYIDRARARLDEIRTNMAEENYKNMAAAVDKLAEKGNFREAITECRQYLQKDPPGRYAKKAESMITELDRQIESRDFEELKNLMIQGATPEKIDAITSYLEKYPDGAHREKVEKMLSEISGEYFVYVKNQLDSCEADGKWQQCASLCENYINRYDNSYADKLKIRLEKYREKIKQNKIMAALQRKANDFGTDYDSAIQVYEDYLSAYPKSEIAGRVEKKIKELEKKKKQKAIEASKTQFRKLLEQTGQRYSEKSEGVVTDSKTGLMWQLLDTTLTKPDECITYEKARQYVENLSAGGFNDWRLPKAEELAGIYKSPPYFPALENKWYWTVESYSSYSDGQWQKIVDTVSSEHSTNWEVERRDSRQCGAVRAVRK